MSPIDILQASRIPPFLTEGLRARYTVHPRESASPEVLARVRASVGGGEARIDAALMDQCPKLEVITICGVGYDGVDVQAAKARGVPVTYVPGASRRSTLAGFCGSVPERNSERLEAPSASASNAASLTKRFSPLTCSQKSGIPSPSVSATETVRVATMLVTDPATFVTTTE